jgi:glycosyltransferase involved in cell wall biosynthesis
MHVWVVNPFDPLPGDPDEPEGRYATLARVLVANGHSVCWWTSSFGHRFKRPVDQDVVTAQCNTIGVELQFMPAVPYYRNVGLRRVLNHYLLARSFRRTSRQALQRPDVVIASSPPPMLAYQAAKFAKECGAKVIVDVQDIWPDAFYSFIPNSLRPLCSIAFLPWSRKANNAYKLADAIIGLTETYVTLVTKRVGVKKISAAIPLGLDYRLFDSAAPKGYCPELTKPAGEIWFTYAGSLTRNHDFLTLTKAFAKTYRTLGVRARLFIAGQGYLSGELRHIIEKQRLANITQTGFLDLNSLAYLLTQCDIGFNPSWPETMIYLPYRLFYYFAAGLAILNTMPGECSQIVSNNQCGLDYQAGDVDSCARAIKEIVSDPGRLRAMQQNSRRLAETTYDRRVLYQHYVKLVEKVADMSPCA